ncbi:MAG: transposase [Selenomonadaceae bacterium]|nr:transposase [Selenomonadaceae bacterium]
MDIAQTRWRDLPTCFGNWNSVYHKFLQWIRLGLFEKILQTLNFATNGARKKSNRKITWRLYHQNPRSHQ